MFRVSDVLIINKIDLLDYVEFNVDTVKQNALSINAKLKIFEMSCKTGEGLNEWVDWLYQNVHDK
jgi:hydrogenase nickel incorporation protein HypB